MLSFSISLLLAASAVSAQSVVDSLSFGHKGTIADNSFNIPGWAVAGEGHTPQMYSDKVILTPPYGGNKRGSLWTKAKSQSKDWAATLEFRANSVDHGKGNMQLWYTKDGEKTVGTASVFTAGRFDGLALLVDVYEGVQKIRGFLNDGNTDYKNHANPNSLAFGHCDYSYRNLGRPSKLQVRSTSSGLEVLIDGKQCFSTSKVNLPTDYNFGITSASGDPPDSFEVFKFEVSTTSPGSIVDSQQPIGQNQGDTGTNQRNSASQSDLSSGNYLSSESQFQDLNNRFNGLSKSISNMFNELNQHTKAEEQRYQEILRQLPTSAKIGNLESKLSNLDRLLTELASELKGGDHKTQFEKLSAQLRETNQGLTEHLPGRMRDYVQNHTPRIGFIVFSFMAFQSCCLAVLLWQKWRKSTMPKKFL